MNDRTGHLRRQLSQVPAQQRQRLLGQRDRVIWLTGLSGAGKSSLAYALEARLCEAGRHCVALDGDNLRHGLCADLYFSPAGRRRTCAAPRKSRDCSASPAPSASPPSSRPAGRPRHDSPDHRCHPHRVEALKTKEALKKPDFYETTQTCKSRSCWTAFFVVGLFSDHP